MKLSISFPNMNRENYPSSQGQRVAFMYLYSVTDRQQEITRNDG